MSHGITLADLDRAFRRLEDVMYGTLTEIHINKSDLPRFCSEMGLFCRAFSGQRALMFGHLGWPLHGVKVFEVPNGELDLGHVRLCFYKKPSEEYRLW